MSYPQYHGNAPQGQYPNQPMPQGPYAPQHSNPQMGANMPYGGAQPGGYPPGQAPGYPAGQAPGYPAGQAPGYAAGQAPGYPAGQAPASGYPPFGNPPAGAAAGPLPPLSGGYVDQPTFHGETAPEDVMDNTKLGEEKATAPPLEKMDAVPGYNNINFDQGTLAAPPSYDEATRHPEPTHRDPPANLPVINEDQAREALFQYAAEHCCYGSSAARDMQFRDIKSSSAFHYTLESFGENRLTAWAAEPFKGQPIDGPMNGPAPLPWDVVVAPPQKFVKKHVVKVEVPRTASVKPCHKCIGNGRVRCHRCLGRGRVICSCCSGKGRVKRSARDMAQEGGEDTHKTCSDCKGSGRKRCDTCHGHGQVNCKTCDARGQLKCFIQLTVTWQNHTDDHIVERSSLPDELIRTVQGHTVFEEENPWLWPINHFQDQSINSASSSLIQKHRTSFPTERILTQRHKVRIVPVSEVVYEYKNKTGSFHIYGFENKVYAPKYPEKCACTIL